MSDLPNELLLDIFSHVSSNDLNRVRLVDRRVSNQVDARKRFMVLYAAGPSCGERTEHSRKAEIYAENLPQRR